MSHDVKIRGAHIATSESRGAVDQLLLSFTNREGADALTPRRGSGATYAFYQSNGATDRFKALEERRARRMLRWRRGLDEGRKIVHRARVNEPSFAVFFQAICSKDRGKDIDYSGVFEKLTPAITDVQYNTFW